MECQEGGHIQLQLILEHRQTQIIDNKISEQIRVQEKGGEWKGEAGDETHHVKGPPRILHEGHLNGQV